MNGAKVRVRFAPSPTGFLHVGNARTALFNWLFARQKGGSYILRVEDTDVERSALEYERKLMEDLRWLGLDWDEGPDKEGQFGPYRQSQRLPEYAAHSQILLDQGQAYHCFCTPEELEKDREKARAAGQVPVYSGKCRSLSPETSRQRMAAGEKAVVRLKTPREGRFDFVDLVRGELSFELSLVGDPVLLRPTGLPAYNYAVVIDDHLMQITHVIRGEDHIANTVRQILVFTALGWDTPQYAHLSMVMGEDNTRLSKRHGATAVDQFGRDGILPEALFNYLALLGWAPPEGQEVLSQDELIRLFNLRKVSRSAAIFDYQKLHWLNRQHMKNLSPREQAVLAAGHLQQAGLLPQDMQEDHWDWLEQAVISLLERVDRFADLRESIALLFDFSLEDLGPEQREALGSECAGKVIRAFAAKLSQVGKFDYAAFAEMVGDIKSETGCKGKELFHPLRVALTARVSGLDLDKFIPLVETGAQVKFPRSMKNCQERVRETLKFLENVQG